VLRHLQRARVRRRLHHWVVVGEHGRLVGGVDVGVRPVGGGRGGWLARAQELRLEALVQTGAVVGAGRTCRAARAAPVPMHIFIRRMMSCMCGLLDVSAIWGEVKIFRVVLKVVLFKEISQFLPRSELHPTGAVNIDVPAAGLLAVLALLQLADPAVGQRVVAELEDFRQVGRPPPDLHVTMGGAFAVTGKGNGGAGEAGPACHGMEGRAGRQLLRSEPRVRVGVAAVAGVGRVAVHVGGGGHGGGGRRVVQVHTRPPRIVVAEGVGGVGVAHQPQSEFLLHLDRADVDVRRGASRRALLRCAGPGLAARPGRPLPRAQRARAGRALPGGQVLY